MRQVMAKIPGIHIWESDPSGIQIGIAARGLSPNRSWEFNIRQNGYDIAADPFGYPEAYYNPQLQAVQRIEVVRGQGSLQYGPQFGGLVNYILRNGSEITKKMEFESQQTVGSGGLFNSYNAIGGKSGKWHYYSFFDHRNGEGFRDNSRYFTNAGFGTVTYYLNPRLSLTAEVMHSHIRSQQPGGLTDSMANVDPKQSSRSRNWFDITWTNPALILNYQLSSSVKWNTKLFATIGDRNSVGFLQNILVRDTMNQVTGEFNNRTLTLDEYRNFGLESRVLADYSLGKMKNSFSGGIRLYTGSTYRRADGKGTTGSDYDMTVIGEHPREVTFKSNNAALFAENIFRVSDKFLVVPGIRLEWLEGSASGRNGFASNGSAIILQDISRDRTFILAGIGSEFHVSSNSELYANITQAYRPIQFANLQAPPTTDVVDQDLEDSKGYNADLGYRGKFGNFIRFDLGVFYLQYNNRIGTVTVTGSPSYRLITNVGNSTSKGFEGFGEVNVTRLLNQNSRTDLYLFGSYSFTDARYSNNHKNAETRGKKVENAPAHIFRGGATAACGPVMFTVQLNRVSETFSDANNTPTPSANAQNGLIPAYTLADLTLSYRFSKNVHLKTGINNLFNEKYFTRRAGGYPGPGVLPGDGRAGFVSFGFKL
jgi:Fe(3+) dicitrate transport protein